MIGYKKHSSLPKLFHDLDQVWKMIHIKHKAATEAI